jgi:hypothetical protein
MYGYNNNTTAPTLEQLDGRVCILNETGAFSVPLECSLFNSDLMIPLFCMPQIQIRIYLESLSSIFTTTVVPTQLTFTDCFLTFETLDYGKEYENALLQMPLIELKTQLWDYTSQSLAIQTGTIDLNYSITFKWLKSVFVLFQGSTAQSLNKLFDAFDPTSGNGDISINVGGQIFPSRPLKTNNIPAILNNLKQAVGNLADKSNNMAINSIEVLRKGNDTTTYSAPAKCYFGFNVQRLDFDSYTNGTIISGLDTAGRNTVVRINTGTAIAQVHPVAMITYADAKIQIQPATKSVMLVK